LHTSSNFEKKKKDQKKEKAIPGTGAGTKRDAGLKSVVGPGKVGRRLLGSIAGPLELCPVGLRTSTYFLAIN